MTFIPKHWTEIPTWRGMIVCPACDDRWGDDDGVEMHTTEAERMEIWKSWYKVDFTGFIPDTGMAKEKQVTIEPEQIDEQFGEGTTHLEQITADDPRKKLMDEMILRLQEAGKQENITDADLASIVSSILGILRFYLVRAGMLDSEFADLVNANMLLSYQNLEEKHAELLKQLADEDRKPKKRSWRDLLGGKRR